MNKLSSHFESTFQTFSANDELTRKPVAQDRLSYTFQEIIFSVFMLMSL